MGMCDLEGAGLVPEIICLYQFLGDSVKNNASAVRLNRRDETYHCTDSSIPCRLLEKGLLGIQFFYPQNLDETFLLHNE